MPSVPFQRTIVVAAEQQSVWQTLTDVQRVAGWVTVVGEVTEIAHLETYETVLADRLGPFKLAADLVARVTELDEPSSITVSADGEDRQVSSRIKIDVTLALTAEPGGTSIAVNGQYEVTGKVATLGASMIRSKGDKILDEFFTAAEKAFQ
jgi:uncharacterized protein